MWSQLPAEVLETFPCNSHIFRKRVGKVIMSKEKESVFLKHGDKTSKSAGM
jgi:hypothetical protein